MTFGQHILCQWKLPCITGKKICTLWKICRFFHRRSMCCPSLIYFYWHNFGLKSALCRPPLDKVSCSSFRKQRRCCLFHEQSHRPALKFSSRRPLVFRNQKPRDPCCNQTREGPEELFWLDVEEKIIRRVLRRRDCTMHGWWFGWLQEREVSNLFWAASEGLCKGQQRTFQQVLSREQIVPESDLSKEALSGTHVDTVLPFFPTASRPAKTSVDRELPTAPRGLNHDDDPINPANLGRVSRRAWPVGQWEFDKRSVRIARPMNRWKCTHRFLGHNVEYTVTRKTYQIWSKRKLLNNEYWSRRMNKCQTNMFIPTCDSTGLEKILQVILPLYNRIKTY